MPGLSKTRKAMITTMMKESIFEAATSVLGEHGVDGTTMNRVAEAAEVAKSSLYDYFPSKDKLLDFVFDRVVMSIIRGIDETLRADLPAPQKLERILRIAFETGTEHKIIIKLLAHTDQEHQAKQRAHPRVLEAFTVIFEQGIREGSFHPHLPAHTGRIFLGAFRELFELLASSASEETGKEYVSALIDVTLHGVSIHDTKSHATGEASPRLPKP